MCKISRWRIYSFALVIFVGGLLIGASGMFFYCQRCVKRPYPGRPRMERQMRHGGEPGQRFAGRLGQKYGLDEAKQAEIAGAFQKFMGKMEGIRNEFAPKMRTAHEAFIEELRAILPPGVFADWQNEQKKRFSEWHQGRENMPPPPRFSNRTEEPRPPVLDNRQP